MFNLANAFRTNHEIRKEKFISDNAAENVLWYLYSKNEEWPKSSNIFLRKRKFPSYGNRNKKPNFIIFFLESFNSEYISSNSSKAKELNRLKREGTYFPSFFSAGTRSRVGLNALLYSVPPIAGIPYAGIIDGKNIFYPFAEYFNSMGYSTLYMQSASFSDGMVSAKASRFNYTYSWRELFGGDKEKRNDEDGMSLFMKKLKSLPTTKPFLGIYYTALPHHPYNQTIPNKSDSYKNTDEKTRYEYQASYIDENIEKFMKQAEQQDWFKDTVFVFLPDHRGQLAEDFNRDTHTNRDDFLSFAIFYAPEIIKQGYVDKSISGQEDILPTLLDLSEYNGQYFSTGKSLFDNSVNRDCRFVYGEDNRIFVFYEKDYYILLRDSPYNLKDHKILSNKCLHGALAMEELLYSAVYTGVNIEN